MIRVGILGFGQRGSLWRHAHCPEAGSTVVAVCDISVRGRAEAAAVLPKAVITDDLDRLLESDLDALLVLTPDHLHHDGAVRALHAGVAVFCEKPLAITVADCDDTLRTAYETGSRLYVGHNMRHMPVIRMLRSLITDGRIGTVQSIWCRHFVGNGGDYYFRDWHADRRNSTGLLLQKGAHDLDVIHWLAGAFTREVSAMGALQVYGGITERRDPGEARMADWFDPQGWPPRSTVDLNPVVDVEDTSMMIMRLDNGVLASYQQCHFTPDYWRNYTVIGDAGRIENLGDGPGGEVRLWNQRHEGWAPPDETLIIPGERARDHGGADPVMIAEFLRFVGDGGPTDTSPVSARESVAAAIMATESLRSGSGARAVPPLDPELISYFENGQVRT